MASVDKKIASLRKQYHDLVQLSSIKDKDTTALSARCREMTFHIHQRIEYCENRRGQIVVICLSLLAAAIALFAATFLELMQAMPLVIILVRFAALFLFLTSFITLFLYALQTNFHYPFIDVTKTWRWFYHYCLSKEYKPPWFPYQNENERKETQNLHLKDMLKYANSTLQSSAKDELEQDLEQLFLMIANEKYKNSHLTVLRRVISIGLPLATLAMLGAAIVAICN